MSFPRFYRALRSMVYEVLLETSTARDIVRKSGVRQGASAVLGEDILMTFSRIDPSGGFQAAAGPFPDAGSLTTESDFSSYSEARLLANVATPDASSEISTAGAVSVSVPTDAVGQYVSDWSPLSDGEITYSVTGEPLVGLVQLQGR